MAKFEMPKHPVGLEIMPEDYEEAARVLHNSGYAWISTHEMTAESLRKKSKDGILLNYNAFGKSGGITWANIGYVVDGVSKHERFNGSKVLRISELY